MPPPSQAGKPAATKAGVKSPFSALFNDAEPDQPAPQKDDHPDETPLAVAIFVPSLPKPILPLTLTPSSGQETPVETPNDKPALAAEPNPDTVELQQPLAAQPAREELAFAAKLVEAGPQPEVQHPAAPSTAVPKPAAISPALVEPARQPAPVSRPLEISPAQPDAQPPRAADAKERHPEAGPGPQSFPMLQTPAPRDVSSPLTAPSAGTTTPAPAAEHVAHPLERPPAPPLNEITLRVTNADQSSASIRMVDRSGELRIAVRASDAQLADSLRGNVEQLTSRLNNNGWSAEVWRPAAISAPARTQSASQEMSQGQPGTKQDAGPLLNRDQQNRRQTHPDWVEEFYANNE